MKRLREQVESEKFLYYSEIERRLVKLERQGEDPDCPDEQLVTVVIDLNINER